MDKETREKLKDKEVLAMYDVRGIQNYIFRTNHIREIVGASAIVENIIIDGLNAIIEAEGWDTGKYLTDWEHDEGNAFLTKSEIQMQVMFIGGGNAYVLFRTGELCHEVNRRLAKYVLEHTYSLNLAVAMVEKTDSYKDDYEKINKEMRHIKARMPEVKPVGAMPFMAVDSITGYPLSDIVTVPESKYVCTESLLKRKKTESSKENIEKILDNMVTAKGDNSSLAVVHIDGNNMGKRIKAIMENKIDYESAVTAMRSISKNIKDGFTEAYKKMEEYVDDELKPVIKPKGEGRLHRKIILAGDDITFICNAQAAIDAVTMFMREVSTKMLYKESVCTEDENLKKYGFSSCAGIAFFNSHFPFSDAYQVAEACCGSAKAKAKKPEHRDHKEADGNIGNFLDYQICTHIKAADLEEYRKKNYAVEAGQDMIINRPYYVKCEAIERITDLNTTNGDNDVDRLTDTILAFRKIPRGQAKTLRNSYALGTGEVEKYITFLKSRSAKLPEEHSCWYDALELMDLYIGKGEKNEA